MHTARDTGRARAETPAIPSRRGMLAAGAAALVAGAAIATAAHGAPVASPGDDGDDAEITRLCAQFDDCEQQHEAIYATEPDDRLAEAASASVRDRQSALAQRIAGSRVHSAAGILAIARSLSLHNGNGESDFHPEASTLTGCLMIALMREACLLSGLPAPTKLAGRAVA